MAGKKIGELTPLGRNLIASDELELSLAGSAGSRKITGAQIIGAAGGVSSVTASVPLSSSGGATPNITIPQATSGTSGFLAFTDWSTFNNKQAALVSGTNIKTVNGQSILGSGNLSAGGTTLAQGAATSFNQYIAPAGTTNTLLFAKQVTGASLGMILDLDFLCQNTVGGVNPRMRVYTNTSASLSGASQLGFFDVGTTLNTMMRYVRRLVLTNDGSGNWNYIGADAAGGSTDYTPGLPFAFYYVGLGALTQSWIIVTLNNSGSLIAATVNY
jgi:hypothetical protein